MSETPFNAARAALDQLRDQAQRAADEAERFTSVIQSRDYEGWSRRREVCVRVGANGLITAIEYARAAPATSRYQLSSAVMEAHDRALLALREAVDEVAAQVFADAPELASATIAQYHQAIPGRVDLLDDEG